MSNKSSSIKWLFEELTLPEYGENPDWVKYRLQMAEEIHMYEIINAHMGDDNSPESRAAAEDYYNQKFGKA